MNAPVLANDPITPAAAEPSIAELVDNARELATISTIMKTRVHVGVSLSLSGGVAIEPLPMARNLLSDRRRPFLKRVWLNDPDRDWFPVYDFDREADDLTTDERGPVPEGMAEWDEILKAEGFPTDQQLRNFSKPLPDRAPRGNELEGSVTYSSAKTDFAQASLDGPQRRRVGAGPAEEEPDFADGYTPRTKGYLFADGSGDQEATESDDDDSENTSEVEIQIKPTRERRANDPRSDRLAKSFIGEMGPVADWKLDPNDPDIRAARDVLAVLPGWDAPRRNQAWIAACELLGFGAPVQPKDNWIYDPEPFLLIPAIPTWIPGIMQPQTISDERYDYTAANAKWIDDLKAGRVLKRGYGNKGRFRVRSELQGGRAILAPRSTWTERLPIWYKVAPAYREADAIERLLGERLDNGEYGAVLLRAAGCSWTEIEQCSTKMGPSDWETADREFLAVVAINVEDLKAGGYSTTKLREFVLLAKIVQKMKPRPKSYSPASRLDVLRKKLLAIQEEMGVGVAPATKAMYPKAETLVGCQVREWVAYRHPRWFEASRLPNIH